MNTPVINDPAYSRVHLAPYGPPAAVPSLFHPQCLEESHCCHFDGVLPTQIKDAHGSVNEVIREHWTVPLALSPTIQARDSPVSHKLMHLCACYDSTDRPGLAVFSFPPCGPCPEGVEPWQSGVKQCSVKKIINECWTVPMAPSSHIQVMNISVSPDLTHSQMRYSPSYRPKMAVASSIHPQIHKELHRCSCLGTELGQIDNICCSAKDNISKPQTVPQALSPYNQVVSLPVPQIPTCLKTCIHHSYGPEKAVASTNRHCA
jgi:hypothetical protein